MRGYIEIELSDINLKGMWKSVIIWICLSVALMVLIGCSDNQSLVENGNVRVKFLAHSGNSEARRHW